MYAPSDRQIRLGKNLAAIPERLLLAHAQGRVLFVAGAGISRPSGLPDFRDLTLKVYKQLDNAVHDVISKIPVGVCNQWGIDLSRLTDQQSAEAKRFISGDYDVVLGMLERRIDGEPFGKSKVRQVVTKLIDDPTVKPSLIHRALIRLSDRGNATTIITTNFDLLFERASKSAKDSVQSYALGSIPRPGRKDDFSGILHIHGALERSVNRYSDLVLSDRDFGEFYLRRRVVPDFIYDAARLFNLVLIGYSANDPPMRYLLNAVAADGSRFGDLKERFTFFGTSASDSIGLEDWRGRGITPIQYDPSNNHSALLKTLEKWADFSAINGKKQAIENEIKRIVRRPRSRASDLDRDLFDHLVRRGDTKERVAIAEMITSAKADIGWLNSINDIAMEVDKRRFK